jgi:hypothetical protein
MNTQPPPTFRQPFDRVTNLPGIDTFGEFSTFLRGAIADEDSRIFSESMGEMASHADTVAAVLRMTRRRDQVAPLLMDLLTVLREHRSMVVGLGLAWRGLYEYAGYLQALNNFRVLIGQWLLQAGPWDDELAIRADDVELVAWRTVGDGMLLIDMYEQWLEREEHESALGSLQEPQLERVRQWWQKLRR